MWDPAIITALEMPYPPFPPPIVEERQWRSPMAERARRIAEHNAKAYEQFANAWRERLDKVRAAGAALPIEPLPSELLARLDELIAEIEDHAEQRARTAARFEKRIARQVKQELRGDPALAAIHRELGERLLRVDQKIIEELLDYALFVRALRSQADPAARGGPTFDDPRALAQYLRTALAS